MKSEILELVKGCREKAWFYGAYVCSVEPLNVAEQIELNNALETANIFNAAANSLEELYCAGVSALYAMSHPDSCGDDLEYAIHVMNLAIKE